MVAEARRHVGVAQVPDAALYDERWAIEREVDLQFEAKWIQLETGFIGPQPESRAGGRRVEDFEWPDAREAVSGETTHL